MTAILYRGPGEYGEKQSTTQHTKHSVHYVRHLSPISSFGVPRYIQLN